MFNLRVWLLALCLFGFVSVQAQDINVSEATGNEEKTNKKDGGYKFTTLIDIEALPVQSQGRTGTCWSFSALSFFESELIRTGKGEHNLSEMFIVRNAYVEKAINYVRMHGNSNFSAGGAFHDIPYVIRKYGIMPEEAYKGLNYGSKTHNHSELNNALKGMVDAFVKNPQKNLTTSWIKAVEGVVDAYLGEIPEKFTYKGNEYTPLSFAKYLELDMDNYVSLTSFTHHPQYKSFVIEVPDNWAMQSSYNVSLEEFTEVALASLENGYSWAWGSDVSEKGFSFKNGLAIVPVHDSLIKVKGKDKKHFNDAGADKLGNAFDSPMDEKVIDATMRQKGFDNYSTTDDHGMHVTGTVKDQNGTKYFIVKNSWGTKYNDCDGYFYCSIPFFEYKSINIFMHKDALPKSLKKKLGVN